MTTPRTAAGRSLVHGLWERFGRIHEDDPVRTQVLAIEAEARADALDEARAAVDTVKRTLPGPNTERADPFEIWLAANEGMRSAILAAIDALRERNGE